MRTYSYVVSVRLEPTCPAAIIKTIFLDHGFAVQLIHRYTSDIATMNRDGSNIPIKANPYTYYRCMYYTNTPCDDVVRNFVRDDEHYIVSSKFEKIFVNK